MSNWTKIISFREIEDDSRRLYDIWISWFGKGTWKRNNCGFIQVFSKKPGFEYDWDDAVEEDEIELLFSFGPTDENSHRTKFHLRDYLYNLLDGVHRASFGNWWVELYHYFNPNPPFISDKDMRSECSKWIDENCAFRLLRFGRQSNLWRQLEPTEDTDIMRIVPDSFRTYDPFGHAADVVSSRPRRAEIMEIHPRYITPYGEWTDWLR